MEHQDAGLHGHDVRLARGHPSPAAEAIPERARLYTTARDVAVDAWRRRSKRVGEVVTDMIPEPPPSADEADRAVEAWTVAEAVGRLSAPHREVLVQCFYRGRSVAEAAAVLGVPAGTLTSRVHYALRSLRMILNEMGVTG